MKLLITLFLLCPLFVFSQDDFAPLGAEWKFTKYEDISDFPFNCKYNDCDASLGKLKAIDTTTIDGKHVSVLRSSRGRFDPEEIITNENIFLHHEEGKVYFYDQDSFYLCYDFNAVDGDSLTIHIPSDINYFGIKMILSIMKK